MSPASFNIICLIYLARGALSQNDSAINTDSMLNDCPAYLTSFAASSCLHSRILYSDVKGSRITHSLVNATYDHERLSYVDAFKVFSNIDLYFFNRILNSDLVNAIVDRNVFYCTLKGTHFNSTISGSRVADSKVYGSLVAKSSLLGDSTTCASYIYNSTMDIHSSVTRSVATYTSGSSCLLINSEVNHIQCYGSRVVNSKVTMATLTDATVVNSGLSGQLNVELSLVINSKVIAIRRFGRLTNSKILGSTILNSNLTNCLIINSSVQDRNWDSVTMTNGIIS